MEPTEWQKMETKELHKVRPDGERATRRRRGAMRGHVAGSPYTGWGSRKTPGDGDILAEIRLGAEQGEQHEWGPHGTET